MCSASVSPRDYKKRSSFVRVLVRQASVLGRDRLSQIELRDTNTAVLLRIANILAGEPITGSCGWYDMVLVSVFLLMA